MDDRERLHGIDVIRGIAIISMVAFHACYDLVYLYGVRLPLLSGPVVDIWRASISWTFLVVAGSMCCLSHDNLRRAGRYLALSLAIFVVTFVAGVDDPISFGIIFCMGASTLVAALLERVDALPSGVPATIALAVAFVVLLHLPAGTIGIGTARAAVPSAPYECALLAWLGFPGPGFVSGDYYPLLPYCLLYLAGTGLWRTFGERISPVMTRVRCRPLEFVGRHPLAIYVAHQPIILGFLWALASLGVIG